MASLVTTGYERTPTPDALADSLAARPTAVMCLEHDPEVCRRRDRAEEIVRRRLGVVVIDL